MKKALLVLLIAVLFIWLGMVAGISFLEAPLKFRAPGITRELGLGIGRLVFQAMNKIELVFFVISFFSLIVTGYLKKTWVLWLLLTTVVLFQSFYLLPILDDRAELILAGQPTPESNHHWIYILTDIVKLGILFLFGREILIYYKEDNSL